MNLIAKNISNLHKQLQALENTYHRPPGSVKLLAVSKGQSIEKIRLAIAAGQRWFGENYIQDALTKIEALVQENLEWHFIGAIQSNKTKAIAQNFQWVHSVDRLKIAERLNAQRSPHLPRLNVCIEVNVSEETSKSGIHLSELENLALAIQALPRLQLRGLMTIPKFTDDFSLQRIPYQKLHQAWQQLRDKGFALDTLSMGMSDDFAAAIAEGSTMVRIGTAIFGKRTT